MGALWNRFFGSAEPTVAQQVPQGVHADVTNLWQEGTVSTDRSSTALYNGTSMSEHTTSSQSQAAGAFSLLELRDRVVIMLLFDQIAREDQVEKAWGLWQKMSQEGVKEPLWRILTQFPDLDRELIYAEAARVYGFEEARISRRKALRLIHETRKQFPKALWDELVDLQVVPIAEAEQKHRHHMRVVFATQDPTRQEIQSLMERLPIGGFELRYATEHEVVALLVEAFPNEYQHLKELSGVAQGLLTGPDFLDYDEEAEGVITQLDTAEVTLEEVFPEDTLPNTSLVNWFEEVLVEAVRAEASDVCLLPNPNHQTEVYFQFEQELRFRRRADHFSPNALLAVIKTEIIGLAESEEGKIQKRYIQRWIDGKPVRFRVSFVPVSPEVRSECIVIRVFEQ